MENANARRTTRLRLSFSSTIFFDGCLRGMRGFFDARLRFYVGSIAYVLDVMHARTIRLNLRLRPVDSIMAVPIANSSLARPK
jgi:hypothetical protein